ncbi:MAG: hypothetical protein JW917_08815 [Ignavibacteria bacterium]|nr:hypothetical protein [Ignavibacteria bacterium]
MLRKLFIISNDKQFTERVNMMSVMLKKLNYFIDLRTTVPENPELPDNKVFYIIADLDSDDIFSYISEIRNNESVKYNKIIGVYSEDNPETKIRAFKTGCDTVMMKEEFLTLFDSIVK